MKEIKISAKNYHKAFQKLEEGIAQVKDELDRDGVLQRFEFTYELFWKTLKLILEFEGLECKSPRSCIKEAFKNGYLKDGEAYLDMLEDRNLTSHVYEEQTSKEIYVRIKDLYLVKLAEADDFFQKSVGNL